MGIEIGLGSGGQTLSLLISDPMPFPLPLVPSGRSLLLPRSKVSCLHSMSSLNGSFEVTESRLRLLLSSRCSRLGDCETRVARLTAVVLFPRRLAAASRSGQAVLLTNFVSRTSSSSSSSSVGINGWKDGVAASVPWPLATRCTGDWRERLLLGPVTSGAVSLKSCRLAATLRPVADVEGTIGVLVEAEEDDEERDESEASRVGAGEVLEVFEDILVLDKLALSEGWRSLRGEPLELLGAHESSSGDGEANSKTSTGKLVEAPAGSLRWWGRRPLVDDEDDGQSACAIHSGRV